MFIVATKTNGKRALKLATNFSYRKNGVTKSQTKIVKFIGYLDKYDDGKPNYLQRLRESFKEGNPLIEELKDYDANSERKQINVTISQNSILNPKIIGNQIINTLYEKLGIRDILTEYKSDNKLSYDINGITKLLVNGRILNPKSKISTLKQNEDYLFKPAKLREYKSGNTIPKELYNTLDVLDKLSIKIQKRVNYKLQNSNDFKHDSELLFYDVTNTFWETERGDFYFDEDGNKIKTGLRQKGVSKEKRPNPIVQMGLFLDNNAIPISYKLFKGSDIDQTTLSPALLQKDEIIKDYKRVIVVGDMGVNSDKNICSILDAKKGYIVSKSVKQATKEYKDWMLDNSEYIYPYKNSNFKYKSKIFERTVIDREGNKRVIKEKRVCFYSHSHFLKEQKDHKHFLDYLEEIIKNPSMLKIKEKNIKKFLKESTVNKKTGEKIKDSKKEYEVNIEKLKYFKDLMGYYMIASSEFEKDPIEIINNYRGLTKIENAFRIIKSNLSLRPVYVYTDEHINAHFLICFISFLILRLIQVKVLKENPKLKKDKLNWTQGITAENIKEELNSFQVDLLSDAIYKNTKITDNLKLVYESFGINIDLNIPTIKDINIFKNKIQKIEL